MLRGAKSRERGTNLNKRGTYIEVDIIHTRQFRKMIFRTLKTEHGKKETGKHMKNKKIGKNMFFNDFSYWFCF